MIDVLSLFTIGFAFFVVAVSPGPATLSNATIAMSKGRKIALVYGLGLSSGMFLWGVVAVSGMGAVLQSSVYVLMVLKVLGGLYLLRLAYVSFKASLVIEDQENLAQIQACSYRKWFMRGFILNSSNPKTVVAWMAALSMGMQGHNDVMSLILALLTCMLVGYLVNIMYSLVFSVKGIMGMYQKCRRWVERAAAGMFALAGFGLLKSALNRS
ncbi:LysE family translocator [Marinomonas posidonica]|uniref:Lysine exporter protein (LYSE/YGGA) n=1 Tax=Marinomonas posidonica (strain CECT 7376 / NCIMB 14433 / IVIA-Po-181) TaxID=491952 RepID=F6CUR2_MARPP|nr:LysE family translocator [Marinomonas posidonica]AEF54172.1 Lysine exporter protein (LYSE/YGGA) [Marinomonas posidonica IVIA-Po-181]